MDNGQQEPDHRAVLSKLDEVLRRLDEQKAYMVEQFEHIEGMMRGANRDRAAMKGRITKLEQAASG